MSQIPREIIFDEQAREKLANGAKILSKAVKSTLGASGQTVLIESQNHLHGKTITKDGITVAKEVHLIDPVENLAVQIIRDASDKTATEAGDGSSTAIVFAEALVVNGLEMIKPEHDKTEVIRELHKLTDKVLLELKKKSKKLTKGRMKDVATISANNDKFIGGLVANAYSKAGKNALVSIDKSDNSETYIEVTNGIKIKRGFDTMAYINNQTKDECVLNDAYVLITDHQIQNFGTIESILTPIVQSRKPLLIIGNVSAQMKNMLAANVVKNGLELCSIVPPQFGYKQKEMLGDLAIALGGKYFSESTGDDLSLVTMEDLGFASKIKVDRDSTTITNNKEGDDRVSERIAQLKEQIKSTKKKVDIDHLNERIAILDGSMGVIFAGGNSDVEQKELYDRIEDAVCAVRSALEEGVIPGGGTALLKIAQNLNDDTTNQSREIASNILYSALIAPFRQILTNAGKDEKFIDRAVEVILTSSTLNLGYDAKSNKYVDMVQNGILDPLKVTSNALRNAVSVAATILSTNAIITLARE
jgi:chaperonin GroEL